MFRDLSVTYNASRATTARGPKSASPEVAKNGCDVIWQGFFSHHDLQETDVLTLWLRDCLVLRQGASPGDGQELELSSTGAVVRPNGSGKLNAEKVGLW